MRAARESSNLSTPPHPHPPQAVPVPVGAPGRNNNISTVQRKRRLPPGAAPRRRDVWGRRDFYFIHGAEEKKNKDKQTKEETREGRGRKQH